MTILVMFHQSQGYRNFKGYYTEQVHGRWHREFPDAPSYTRLVQLLPVILWPLVHYLGSRRGEVSGISFVESTPLKCVTMPAFTPTRSFRAWPKEEKAQRVGSLALSCT